MILCPFPFEKKKKNTTQIKYTCAKEAGRLDPEYELGCQCSLLSAHFVLFLDPQPCGFIFGGIKSKQEDVLYSETFCEWSATFGW